MFVQRRGDRTQTEMTISFFVDCRSLIPAAFSPCEEERYTLVAMFDAWLNLRGLRKLY
ncbi:MAG: hypothetical protein KME42_04140 [Tildeniella nuda ZEHNDER 1965/U140]|nr:hypothetical protein [Tildeniella nuda ZEHNDER 1965/U140]